MTSQGPPVSVDEFYRGANILVTGGTGFMGKILLDKLLRGFPDLGTIYVMARSKKGTSPEERMEKIFNTVVFDRLNGEVPDFRSKVKVIPGDNESEGLGLSETHRRLLAAEVNIIFHCAATMRFDEELQVGIKSNLFATSQVLRLAKQCDGLKMFTYVSTAFCHAKMQGVIEEKIYPTKTSYKELLHLLSLSPDDPKLSQAKTKLLLENANTYTTTKAASEQLLSEEGGDCPVSIFRPSIVISTFKDPIPGWIDNLYGPTGLVTGAAAGVVRTIYCNPDVTSDLVPVDLTVNALVCSTADAYNRRIADPNCLPMYNYVSSKDNPIKWGTFQNNCFLVGINFPPSQALMYCFSYMTGSKALYTVLSFFLHYMLGYVFDFFFWMSGQPLRLIPIYRRLDKASDALEPFSSRDFNFDNRNVKDAWSRLSPDVQSRFPFNIADMDWLEYLEAYMRGLLVHHLKDSFEPEVRKKALKRYYRLYLIHLVVKGVLYAVLGFFLWFLSRLFMGTN